AEINSHTVYLLGRVAKPGAVKLRSPKTFLQVLAMAGGFQEFAETDKVVLVRWEGGKEARIPVDARKIIAKGTEGDFVLRPGDVVIVP
ncbi:MAG: polysaccharide biosynthesis/export family protein, partial [Deferrisomatales bacterium]